ncbi:hypothetical protein [Treponema endosymbiont of Eucomonympha sp.]|uniref:hypothetical protein n=1 Tax=Treponema endosymbiont of Eucomonympha sp. TaxID=1580831 RepID=UPI0007513C74|nr:hypothetical protein [Treponema endosymbiont of Eucomonympha sp.]
MRGNEGIHRYDISGETRERIKELLPGQAVKRVYAAHTRNSASPTRGYERGQTLDRTVVVAFTGRMQTPCLTVFCAAPNAALLHRMRVIGKIRGG